jgi:ubiquinone/menaquinone biosynthesis C-methylase UbiE
MTQLSTDERIEELLSPERRDRLDALQIFSVLPLRPYTTVADVGCGPGLLTIPLAKTAWDGHVYAVDMGDAMLEAVQQRAAEARLSNITTMKSEDGKLPLKADAVDGVLLACVLHEISGKASFLKSVVKALKPGGWCGVVEWRTETPDGAGPDQGKRISREDLQDLAVKAGLRPSHLRELNDHYYMLLLSK